MLPQKRKKDQILLSKKSCGWSDRKKTMLLSARLSNRRVCLLRGLYRFWQNFASRNWLSLERWHLNCDTQNTQHILQKISAKARSTEWWVYFFFKLILVTTVKHFFKNFNEFCWHYQYSDFYFETGFHKIEYIVNDLPVSIFDNCSC